MRLPRHPADSLHPPRPRGALFRSAITSALFRSPGSLAACLVAGALSLAGAALPATGWGGLQSQALAAVAPAAAVPEERFRKVCAAPGSGRIASLPWIERSDWINVRTDVVPAARGDGVADDTAAIQAALERIGEQPGEANVVYLPPGTYRISRTLHVKHKRSGMLVGHGRDTVLVWAGRENGRMLWSDGFPRATYIGMVWDGAGSAAIGIDHDSKSFYETRILHEQMEFRNFRTAGIRVGHAQKTASAEMMFSNLRFENNENGVLLQSWNDYNNIFDGNQFVNNAYGIAAEKGNVTVRNSRFEGSRKSDLLLSTHSHSIRRVVSSGSNAFVHTVSGPVANGLVRIENSRIDAWRDDEGAVVTSLRGPVMLFDVTFTNPPGRNPPVRLSNPIYMNQIAILSNVTSNGTDGVIDKGRNGILHEVVTGRKAEPLVSLQQVFLRDHVPLAATLLDVRQDCGAKGDGENDDFDAIQRCLDRAHGAKETTVVYFPSGTYRVSGVLQVRSGAKYRLEGTGWFSRIVRPGKTPGTVLHVHDPDGLVVERLALGGPAGSTTLWQTGSRPGAVRYHNVFGYYDGETRDERILLDGLPAGTLVVADHLDGRILIRNSSDATILLGFLVSVQMTVESASPRGGFLGVLSRVSALEEFPLVVEDNQSLIVTDWYNEQSRHLALLRGNGADRGSVILDHTQAMTDGGLVTRVDGYHGYLAQIGGMFGRAEENQARYISASDDSDIDVLLAGNIFWNKSPQVVAKSARMELLGNSISKRVLGPFAIVDDRRDPEMNDALEKTLDAFRGLGTYDLMINYCISR